MSRTFLLVAVLAAAAGPTASLQAQGALEDLIPRPREGEPRAAVSLARGVAIVRPANPADRHAAADLDIALRERGVRVAPAGAPASVRVALLRSASAAGRTALARHGLSLDGAMRDEGYVLVAEDGRAEVIGATAAGVFYGVQTLKQLVDGDGAGARLRGARIRDWPAMRYRGLNDDLSRGPVPTLEFQKKQIRTFAAYKINVYSPYFEHTLEYASNPLIAPPGGAMTRAQVRELVDYARRYHVDVIPEQEAFGHLHHVLKHELYSPLGETSHGHVLAPGHSGSLPLIRQMFAEIDSLFPSRFIHLGADETFELGRGQTSDRVKGEGIGAVYLDFLRQIEASLRPTGKRFLFWGDVAMNHPELVRTLPRGLIAVAWHYTPRDSFDEFLTPFTEARMETWVAPGVNNWNRVYPNYSMALPNIQRFVRDGQRLGSTGVLNTTWDDDGEALFAQTWYGVLFGAAASWQSGESSIEQFQRSYGRAFHGDTTGRIDEAQRKLMAAHALLQRAVVGDASDYLFWLDPWSPEGRVAAEKIRPIARDVRLLAEEAIVLLAQARPRARRERAALDAIELGARRIDLLGMKFQFADDVARMYGRAYAATTDSARRGSPTRDLADATGINGRLQDLRDAYSLLRDEYERAWLAENRPYWLRNVLARYDLATQLWLARADRINAARQQWYRTRTLPPPEAVGVPSVPIEATPVAR
jgi:hypothetical protein